MFSLKTIVCKIFGHAPRGDYGHPYLTCDRCGIDLGPQEVCECEADDPSGCDGECEPCEHYGMDCRGATVELQSRRTCGMTACNGYNNDEMCWNLSTHGQCIGPEMGAQGCDDCSFNESPTACNRRIEEGRCPIYAGPDQPAYEHEPNPGPGLDEYNWLEPSMSEPA
jgi:hypothetical protein